LELLEGWDFDSMAEELVDRLDASAPGDAGGVLISVPDPAFVGFGLGWFGEFVGVIPV
jgi:hypothetical protein